MASHSFWGRVCEPIMRIIAVRDLWLWLAPFVAAGGTAMFSWIKDVPGPWLLVITAMMFAAVFWVVAVIVWMRERHQKSRHQKGGRDFFVGAWNADRKASSFQIVLLQGGAAQRKMPNGTIEAQGNWEYAHGEARVTWKKDAPNGAILRLTPDGVFRFPFYHGLPDFKPDEEGSLVVRQG